MRRILLFLIWLYVFSLFSLSDVYQYPTTTIRGRIIVRHLCFLLFSLFNSLKAQLANTV